ncbi:hypothetical protein ACQ9PV_25675, partial [Escherichia coli]|uniref:hypothetical protein n=1 Tax=Escherichia coli TaxID=562 RepID=UPI003FD1C746
TIAIFSSVVRRLRISGPKTSIICSPMTSLKTSIKTITYLSDIGCLEIQGASLADYGAQLYNSSNEESTISLVMPDAIEWNGKNTPRRQYMIKYIAVFKY